MEVYKIVIASRTPRGTSKLLGLAFSLVMLGFAYIQCVMEPLLTDMQYCSIRKLAGLVAHGMLDPQSLRPTEKIAGPLATGLRVGGTADHLIATIEST